MQLQVVKPEFSLNSSTPEHRFSIIRKYYLTKEIKTCLKTDLAQGKTKLKNNIQIIPLLCSEPHNASHASWVSLYHGLGSPWCPILLPLSSSAILFLFVSHSTPASLLFFKCQVKPPCEAFTNHVRCLESSASCSLHGYLPPISNLCSNIISSVSSTLTTLFKIVNLPSLIYPYFSFIP